VLGELAFAHDVDDERRDLTATLTTTSVGSEVLRGFRVVHLC
jgi:hypothetical protein